MNLPKSVLTKNQKRIETKTFTEGDQKYTIRMEIRYDDQCNNGHNSFSMTGDIYRGENIFRDSHFECGGCIHEELAKHFPKFKKYLKWHLVSSDSPMHYLANALYHISDKDCWGYRKGEPYNFVPHFRFNDIPYPLHFGKHGFMKWLIEQDFQKLEVVELAYKPEPGKTYDFSPKYGFKGFKADYRQEIDWYSGIFDTRREAEQLLETLQTCKVEIIQVPTSFGKGKEPDLEAAREAAKWPDAQPEDFTEEKMNARLPALMEEFKHDMEELGFIY